jgi:AcrR family transcriptional regulator
MRAVKINCTEQYRKGQLMRVRTASKRDQIIEVAAKAFMETGYERTSMAEIAAGVGGSKATLYGYFPSKEELFVAVAERLGEGHMQEALAEISKVTAQIDRQLQLFGEKFLAFISTPQSIAIQRVLTSESAHSNVGQLFYQSGPKIAVETIAEFMQTAMDRKLLGKADPMVATLHLLNLLQAEVMPLALLGMPVRITKQRLQGVVKRAVDVFIAAYGPERSE